MTPALIDANVFLYAIGTEHHYREPCRELVAALARGQVAGEVSVEILQEVVHVRRRRGDPRATDRARQIAAWGLPVHPLEPDDLAAALGVLDEHPGLSTRDAVHVATARRRGLELIVSADADFDQLGAPVRVDPADPRLRARLA